MDAGETAAALVRARQGDDEAFRALVERHSVQAFRLAFRMTGNEQDAEDVVQESFLRAYRQLGRFQARSNFGTWLYRIVANCSVDHIRARRNRWAAVDLDTLEASGQSPAVEHPGPERLAHSVEIRRRMDAALDGLSPLERAAFMLRHHEGRSLQEIGQALGLRTSATKNSVFRAVRKLRLALESLRSES